MKTIKNSILSSEAMLVARCLSGDQGAFTELYQLHYLRIYYVLFRMTHHEKENTEDLLQETFIRVFQKLSLYRGEARLNTWIHSIAVNTFLMWKRKNASKQKHISFSLDDEMLSPTKKLDLLSRRDPQLDSVVERVVINKTVKKLTPSRCTVISYHLLGYNQLEIAKIKGCSVGAIKSQIHHAKVKIKEMLL